MCPTGTWNRHLAISLPLNRALARPLRCCPSPGPGSSEVRTARRPDERPTHFQPPAKKCRCSQANTAGSTYAAMGSMQLWPNALSASLRLGDRAVQGRDEIN